MIQSGGLGGKTSKKSHAADPTILRAGASGFRSMATTSFVFWINATTKDPPPADGSKTNSWDWMGNKPTKNAARSRGV